MKRFLLFFAAASLVFLSACEGDPGPPGPIGPQGPPGDVLLGQVFEAQVTFTNNNNFQRLIEIPTRIEVFESDTVLVYWLEEVNSGLDVWTPLPQTIYLEDGQFQYTFNHTFVDVLLFLQGDINLNSLGPGFTDDQIFRIAIIPAEFGDANFTMDEIENSGNFEFVGN